MNNTMSQNVHSSEAQEREERSEQLECTKTQVHLWLLLSMPKHPLCPSQKPQRFDKVCRIHREENVAANIVLAQKECAETTCTFLAKCCRAFLTEKEDLSCRALGLTQFPFLLSRGLNLLSIREGSIFRPLQ